MNRRSRARVRLEVFDYARRYLGVKRLPAGVPKLLNEFVATLDGPPSQGALGSLLAPYRKPSWVL